MKPRNIPRERVCALKNAYSLQTSTKNSSYIAEEFISAEFIAIGQLNRTHVRCVAQRNVDLLTEFAAVGSDEFPWFDESDTDASNNNNNNNENSNNDDKEQDSIDEDDWREKAAQLLTAHATNKWHSCSIDRGIKWTDKIDTGFTMNYYERQRQAYLHERIVWQEVSDDAKLNVNRWAYATAAFGSCYGCYLLMFAVTYIWESNKLTRKISRKFRRRRRLGSQSESYYSKFKQKRRGSKAKSGEGKSKRNDRNWHFGQHRHV